MEVKTNFFRTLLDIGAENTDTLMKNIFEVSRHKCPERYQQVISAAEEQLPETERLLDIAANRVDDEINRDLVRIYYNDNDVCYRVTDITYDGPMWTTICHYYGLEPQEGVCFVYFPDDDIFIRKCALLFFDKKDWQSIVKRSIN